MSHPDDSQALLVPLDSVSATDALACRLAQLAEVGDIIGLAGDLGAGKTTFARAFIRARIGPVEVPSP
ncbi:MAG: tRNA (adenosine(37)-N6)-threonylcarbamoyltransferase complex ATPase subunit type 1 TsaE, partial [Alphaproteobacteria bacterium]